MIQQVVFARPEQIYALEFAAGEHFSFVEDLPVVQRQAFEHAAEDLARFARDFLPGLAAIGLDLQRHVARLGKARVGDVNERLERQRCGG